MACGNSSNSYLKRVYIGEKMPTIYSTLADQLQVWLGRLRFIDTIVFPTSEIVNASLELRLAIQCGARCAKYPHHLFYSADRLSHYILNLVN